MFDRIAKHADLFQTMSDRTGADLGEAILSGRLAPETYRGAIFSCTRCGNVEDCQQLLSEDEGTRIEAPDYCMNRKMLRTLAQG